MSEHCSGEKAGSRCSRRGDNGHDRAFELRRRHQNAPLSRHRREHGEIDPGSEGCAQCDADDAEIKTPDERDLQSDVGNDGNDRRAHGCCGVASGIERGYDAAHEHEARQADAVGHQRPRRLRGGIGAERAAHEQRPHQRVGNDEKRRDAGERQQHAKHDRAVLHDAGTLLVLSSKLRRHFGQQDRAERDADDAHRQLIDPVGVVERGQIARGEEARDERVDEEPDLDTSGADSRGTERHDEFAHLRPPRGQLEPQVQSATCGDPDHENELQNSREQYAIGGRVSRGREKRYGQHRSDHGDIQEDRRCGGRAESLHCIQHRGELRHDGDAYEVGKGQPRELDREPHLIGIIREPRRQKHHDLAHEDEREQEQHELHRALPGEHVVGKARCRRCRGGSRLCGCRGVARKEGRVEGSFRKDGPEIVRQAKSHHEGIGHGPGAEHGRHQHAGERGEPADRDETPDHDIRPPKGTPLSRSRGWGTVAPITRIILAGRLSRGIGLCRALRFCLLHKLGDERRQTRDNDVNALWIGMQPIGLNKTAIEHDAFKEKRVVENAVFLGEAREDGIVVRGILAAEISRRLHPRKQDRDIARLELGEDGIEILLHFHRWQPTQAVIGTKLDDCGIGSRFRIAKGEVEPTEPTRARVAGNSAVDDADVQTLRFERAFEPIGEIHAGWNPVALRQAVAQR